MDLNTILAGNVFVTSDTCGDITPVPAVATGLFSFDTRFLSTWVLTVNGERLQPLSVDDLQYFESRFFLVPGHPTRHDEVPLSVIRHRTVGGSFHEELTVINHHHDPVDLTIRLEIGSDFADIYEVSRGDIRTRTVSTLIEQDQLRLVFERKPFRRETIVSCGQPATFDDRGASFNIRVDPQGQWVVELHVDVLSRPTPEQKRTESLESLVRRVRGRLREEQDRWLAEAPKLICDYGPLTDAYRRSLIDLDALQYLLPVGMVDALPAAGLPWAMTVFGRDTLITSLQMLPFVPRITATTLGFLASLQGSKLNNALEEEPGKILCEIRGGEFAAFEERPLLVYYGAADTTPLFVILLDEYERWTGDADLVRDLEFHVRLALNWIDEYGDLMGNGYVWYNRRNLEHGLQNQGWKTSDDAISYRDGRLPAPPRATCELQGYAYDAKIRGARLARLVWNDPAYADRLEREAAELKERLNRDFWVTDGEYYALALDADGNHVDALASNMGHLLWSGIAEPDKAHTVAEHLLGPRLFSGWGVRTLADGEARYNPVGYHAGAVWPFDNSLIAAGLRRYGLNEHAARIAQAMIDATQYFNGRLPEAFAGYDRTDTKYPVRCPNTCSPHALSSGALLSLVRTVLGLEPSGEHLLTNPALPAEIRQIKLLDIPGRWGKRDAFGRSREARRPLR